MYVLPPSLTVGSAVATDGMIWVPAVPDACANEYGPRYVSQCTSPPWVVKSIDGSSDCGNVPITTVAVVPLWLVDDDEDAVVLDDEPDAADDVELDFELPQAASAITTASARALAMIGLVSFFILPPPQKVVFYGEKSIGRWNFAQGS